MDRGKAVDKYDSADSFAGGILHAVAVIEIWRDNYAAAGKADKAQAFEALRQNLTDGAEGV